MASIYGGASGSGWKLRLDYTVTQDRAANTSSLRLRLYLYANTTGSYNLEKDSAYYVLQGQKVYQTYQYTVPGWYLLGERTVTVRHGADGNGSVQLGGQWVSDVESSWTPASLSVSAAVALPRILRPSVLRAAELRLGQAAALSGGYGSSYAQQTGQQAYSQYLSELSALIPELEKQARSRYEQQGQALMDRYGLLQQAEQVDYSRWQDQLKAWQSDSDRAYEYYNSVGKEDRDLYGTMLKYYAGKAADEQKAAGGVRYGSGRTVEGEKPQSLSSTASDSLERAMGNYLKAGDTRSAQDLITLYKERMTPTQKKRFSALFDKYGAAIGW